MAVTFGVGAFRSSTSLYNLCTLIALFTHNSAYHFRTECVNLDQSAQITQADPGRHFTKMSKGTFTPVHCTHHSFEETQQV